MDIGEVNPVVLVCEERFEVRHVVLVIVERHKQERTVAVVSTLAKNNLVRHWLGIVIWICVNILGAGFCKRDSSVSLVLGNCVFYGVAWHFCPLILLQAKVETNASKAKGDQAGSGNSQFCF